VPKPDGGELKVHTARSQEQRIGQLDKGEAAHIAQVDKMREDAQDGREEGEAVDDAE
jgi:hypothetical protein